MKLTEERVLQIIEECGMYFDDDGLLYGRNGKCAYRLCAIDEHMPLFQAIYEAGSEAGVEAYIDQLDYRGEDA